MNSAGSVSLQKKMSSQSSRTRVGSYELGRTLREGTFGKVKFARNVATGQSVAIKVVDREKVLKQHLIDKIKREISTMKLINHPNVVKLHEVMASKTKIYIVMEMVAGGDLLEKITSHGRLKEAEARRYFQQLINALDYCHSRGVYHRNLKPENLLLDANGNLKISEFGLSALPQHIREDGLLHTTCGTPNYVAPEVINDKGYDGAMADLWSCGVTLYVLLAGCLPFDEENLITLYKKISKADFTCPSHVSSSAKDLISRVLDPNPKSRITIQEILGHEWFKKGYKPPKFQEEENINIDDINTVFNESEEYLVTEKKETQPELKNAFELITLSQGLDLSNLFEKGMGIVKQQTSFKSKYPANYITAKIREAALYLGFDVQTQNNKMKLQGVKGGRKGHLRVATEVIEVAPSLCLVELHKVAGDTLEFHEFYQNLRPGLKDILWKSEKEAEESKST